jgi:hypothetical protein
MMAKSLNSKSYDSPAMEEVLIRYDSVLCTSPGDGENEDIGYENWN